MTADFSDRQTPEQRLLQCLASPAALAISHSGLADVVADLAEEQLTAARARALTRLGTLDLLLAAWDDRITLARSRRPAGAGPSRSELTAIAAAALAVSAIAASDDDEPEQTRDAHALDVLLRACAIAFDTPHAQQLRHAPLQALQRDHRAAEQLRAASSYQGMLGSDASWVSPELQALATSAAAAAVVIAVGQPVA